MLFLDTELNIIGKKIKKEISPIMSSRITLTNSERHYERYHDIKVLLK